MSLSSKFLSESTSEKIVKIGQYLANIWKKTIAYFFGLPCVVIDERQFSSIINQFVF